MQMNYGNYEFLWVKFGSEVTEFKLFLSGFEEITVVEVRKEKINK